MKAGEKRKKDAAGSAPAWRAGARFATGGGRASPTNVGWQSPKFLRCVFFTNEDVGGFSGRSGTTRAATDSDLEAPRRVLTTPSRRLHIEGEFQRKPQSP